MARRRSKTRSKARSGKLALKIGLVCGLATFAAAAISVVVVASTFGSGLAADAGSVARRGWILGLVMAVISGTAIAGVAYVQGAALALRLTDLGIGLAKIGRGGEVRIRNTGNDEIAQLGRALQYLATDLQAVQQEAEQSGGGGLGANMDPKVRELRDRALPGGLPPVEGYEVDGAVAPGTRGGLEYYGASVKDGVGVVYLVSNEGVGAASALAARMARDELERALAAGANARKALYHTNRVLHRELPKGTCAKACLLELGATEAKLYQAGYRPPLLVCRAGQLQNVQAEGLALGLDEGPVFEKGLRSTPVPVAQGTRMVLGNEAAMRLEDFAELVVEHSPKHTAPFMNLVLGALESDAGEGGLREDVVLLTAKRW